MPSDSKPPSTLMAMAARNLKRRGTSGKASTGSGVMKKFGGGPASMMGRALSGTQFGQPDSLIRRAQDTFARFADGGAVKKPPGPSAKERKEIRNLIERGKTDAISALRETRNALLADAPAPADTDAALGKISSRLAMKDGGEVDAPEEVAESVDPVDPAIMYQEYAELMEALEEPSLDEGLRAEIMDRLAEIEHALDAVGVELGEEATS
jgi:hypothetical protein